MVIAFQLPMNCHRSKFDPLIGTISQNYCQKDVVDCLNVPIRHKASMNPHEYFAKMYLEDLSVFHQSHQPAQFPKAGPFFMLCGRTMGSVLRPEQQVKFHSAADFLCCQYVFNLINQGLHQYHPGTLHRNWIYRAVPFVDVRGCPQRHGGMSTPNSILQFAKKPPAGDAAQAVTIPSDQVAEYVGSFFYRYLPILVNSSSAIKLDIDEFLSRLKLDADCRELCMFA